MDIENLQDQMVNLLKQNISNFFTEMDLGQESLKDTEYIGHDNKDCYWDIPEGFSCAVVVPPNERCMVDHFEPVDCSEVVVKVAQNKRACRCRCQIKNEDSHYKLGLKILVYFYFYT